MEKRKPGRPKSKTPIRNKNISFRVTKDELELIQKICYDNDMTYVDVMLKGVEMLATKK